MGGRVPRPRASGATRSQLGVSLVELLIAIAILAVIAGLAAPSIGSLNERSRASAAAAAYGRAVQFAKGKAIQNGKAVRLLVNQPVSGCASGDARAAWAVVQTNGTVLQCLTMADFRSKYPDTQISISAGLTAYELRFTAAGLGTNGTAADESPLVTFSSGGASRQVQMVSGGGVRVP